MKRLITVVLCICMAITCSAVSATSQYIEYDDLGITVVFDNDCPFTLEEQAVIADLLVYGTEEQQTSTYAWCWLTGHDLTNTAVGVIEHKVSETEPRCLQTIYDVETCSKCDHFVETAVSSVFIPCCPEE